MTTNSCNVKKIISSMMFMISNHYGIKCLSNLILIVPCNVMFIVISDILAISYLLLLEACNGMYDFLRND